MNELNSILASAFDPRKSILDNVTAVLTLYLSTWLLTSHYDRVRCSVTLSLFQCAWKDAHVARMVPRKSLDSTTLSKKPMLDCTTPLVSTCSTRAKTRSSLYVPRCAPHGRIATPDRSLLRDPARARILLKRCLPCPPPNIPSFDTQDPSVRYAVVVRALSWL